MRPPNLPPQENLAVATQKAFQSLGDQPQEQLLWLGAEPADGVLRLPVLGDVFRVEPAAGRVTAADGREVGPHWRILALHYLAVRLRPERQEPEVTFADLPTARSYADVYRQRVNARLCATIGPDLKRLRAAAGALGARPADGGDAAFDFDVFPRLMLRLIWHEGDEELPASATLLLPGNIESFFCPEDIVVLSERLVSRLGGRGF